MRGLPTAATATAALSLLTARASLDASPRSARVMCSFNHLYRDADVEASTDGFTHSWAGGQISSVHDPKMGWGAGGLYVQHFTLNVGCAYFRPTERAIELLRRVAFKLSQASAWDQQVFNSEAFMLSRTLSRMRRHACAAMHRAYVAMHAPSYLRCHGAILALP